MSAITPMSAEEQIAFAKSISPEIFENKSPYFHKIVLEYLNRPDKRKVIEIFRDGAKSTLLNNIYIIKRMFFDREPYIWIVSDNGRKARSFLRKIKRIVMKMQGMGWDIRRGETWNENESEFVIGDRVCGVACFGAGEDPRGYTSNEGGKRPTLIVADDILSREKAKSKEQREKLKEWWYSDLEPALHVKGEIVLIGTPLHNEDLLSEAIASGEYSYIKVPILINGQSAWPDRKPLEWILQKKQALFSRGMHKTWNNEYMILPQGDEDQLFHPDLFRYFSRLEYEVSEEYLEMGNAKEHKKIHIRKPTHIVLEDGEKIALEDCVKFTTMDLATESGRDRSAIVTCAYDSNGNMYVVDITSGYWSPFEKSLMALKVYKEFKPIRFGIEKAGAQNDFFYTMDVAIKESKTFIPVEALSHKGVAKNIRISNLHPLFAAGKVWFNRDDVSTVLVESELTTFQIDIESAKDDLADALAYQQQFIKNRTFKTRTPRKRQNITI